MYYITKYKDRISTYTVVHRSQNNEYISEEEMIEKHTSELLRQLGLKNMLIPADDPIDKIHLEVLKEFQRTLSDNNWTIENLKDIEK